MSAAPWDELLPWLPPQRLVEALDDDGDGEADAAAWSAVRSAAEDRLQTVFGGAVPPEHFRTAEWARKMFELQTLFLRRGITGAENPYTAAADDAEARLRALASGEEAADGAAAQPVIIGAKASVAGLGGLMA